jgi:predicted  nucleic acid-binding Zn-ribbon protein
MPEVSEDIQLLIQIVKKDLEIQKKKKFLAEAPQRIREIERKIAKMDGELQEDKDQLAKLNKERSHLELDVKTHNEKISRMKTEQISVKTNKEYRAFNSEIEYLTKQIDKKEERILAILEQTEKVKKEIEAISARVENDKGVLLAEREDLEKGMKESTESLKVLEDEKVRILPHVSERVQRLYNRILQVKGDSGVANLVGDICQGCYSRVPPQKAHEIRKNNQIIICEACGRILVYYPVD